MSDDEASADYWRQPYSDAQHYPLPYTSTVRTVLLSDGVMRRRLGSVQEFGRSYSTLLQAVQDLARWRITQPGVIVHWQIISGAGRYGWYGQVLR